MLEGDFINSICHIVDPSNQMTLQEISKLVEEKFTSTNTGSPKLPNYMEVVNEINGSSYGPLSEREVMLISRCRVIIARQLRAGA